MQQFLTWLWQGTMLAVGVWVVLRLLRPSAATRFVIWWATLFAILLLLAVPLGRGSGRPAAAADATGPAAAPASASEAAAALPAVAAGAVAADEGRFAPLTVPVVPASLLAVGIGVWLGLALLGLVHLGVSVSHLQRLKLACRPFPRARERRLVRWLRVRGAGRRTRLYLSEDVRSASVLGLGVGTAIIAIHPALLADLDDEELDHVVLHEYAHVQRRDDWLYVMQLALQALLIVHPAVSSIGRALRLEREAACDDWVVSQTGMATTYARSLTKVAAFELATPNDLVATMGVIGRGSDLTRRVERLLAPSSRSPWTVRRALAPAVSPMQAVSVATLVMAATMGLWRMPPMIVMESVAGEANEASGASESEASSATSTTAAAIHTVLDPLARAAAIIVMPPERQAQASGGAAAVNVVRKVPTSAKRADVPASLTVVNETSTAAVTPAETTGALGSRVFASTWWHASAPLTPTPAVVTTPRASAAPARPSVAAHQMPTMPEVMEEAFGAETSGTPTAPAAAAARTSGPWQRAAGVGVSVGQGAKRIGTATGGFVSRVATSIGKVWP